MSKDHPATPTTGRRIALLVDADNVSQAKIGAIVAELSSYGVANIRRAYGDWTSGNLKGWKDKLHLFAIRPMQQFSYSTGKNATDMALVIDAMELLYTQDLEGFCIVSSDADFTPLVMQLRSNGRDVYGFGERKTPEPFVNACTTFLYLDGLGDAAAVADVETASTKSAAKPSAAAEPKPAEAVRNLAGDTKLITALRGGVEASAREDGWALLTHAATAAQRQASIDPRNYGVKGFTALFEKTKLFEVVRSEGGHPYVADKRNKARAPRPGI
ncbi:NYN domain-containing protein [Sphingomonas endolithica]|uniref:NYN domain-containing protein n=1 Tax=Sphingomonas endolithica TaxID=2972485 RepID=UPI0021AE9060|nr:NYN domain-containing protein [Sphingomonas sp. ZFBP2030]